MSQTLKIIELDNIAADADFAYIKEAHPQPTIAKYGILHHGQRIGRVTMMERPADQEVGFDIYVARTGQNLGIQALQALASSLEEQAYDLVTAGIRAGSARSYWEHQAAQGRVVQVNPQMPQTTNYRVISVPNQR